MNEYGAVTGAACPRNSHGVAHKRSLPQSIAPIPDLRSNLSVSAPGFTGTHTLQNKNKNHETRWYVFFFFCQFAFFSRRFFVIFETRKKIEMPNCDKYIIIRVLTYEKCLSGLLRNQQFVVCSLMVFFFKFFSLFFFFLIYIYDHLD